MKEMIQTEYEIKIRNVFDEIEKLKQTIEENTKEKQAKNDLKMPNYPKIGILTNSSHFWKILDIWPKISKVQKYSFLDFLQKI